MCIGTSITACFGNHSHGLRLFNPLLCRDEEAIDTCISHNSLEFEGIKILIIELLPDPQKLQGVFTPKPILYDLTSIFQVSDHICEIDIVIIFKSTQGNLNAIDMKGLFIHHYAYENGQYG